MPRRDVTPPAKRRRQGMQPATASRGKKPGSGTKTSPGTPEGEPNDSTEEVAAVSTTATEEPPTTPVESDAETSEQQELETGAPEGDGTDAPERAPIRRPGAGRDRRHRSLDAVEVGDTIKNLMDRKAISSQPDLAARIEQLTGERIHVNTIGRAVRGQGIPRETNLSAISFVLGTHHALWASLEDSAREEWIKEDLRKYPTRLSVYAKAAAEVAARRAEPSNPDFDPKAEARSNQYELIAQYSTDREDQTFAELASRAAEELGGEPVTDAAPSRQRSSRQLGIGGSGPFERAFPITYRTPDGGELLLHNRSQVQEVLGAAVEFAARLYADGGSVAAPSNTVGPMLPPAAGPGSPTVSGPDLDVGSDGRLMPPQRGGGRPAVDDDLVDDEGLEDDAPEEPPAAPQRRRGGGRPGRRPARPSGRPVAAGRGSTPTPPTKPEKDEAPKAAPAKPRARQSGKTVGVRVLEGLGVEIADAQVATIDQVIADQGAEFATRVQDVYDRDLSEGEQWDALIGLYVALSQSAFEQALGEAGLDQTLGDLLETGDTAVLVAGQEVRVELQKIVGHGGPDWAPFHREAVDALREELQRWYEDPDGEPTAGE